MGSSIGNAIMDVVTLGSSYQQRKAAKEQVRAANAMAAAMEKQPVVQASAVAAQRQESAEQSEQNVNSAARRRASLSRTVNTPGSAAASLLGGRRTLG
ncbi:hypothetical protein [Akkermansia glycaniphila]|uniref:Uncharacterized protein n=1 Tax=Akkermansia glycaniphila TaxID=1679444 RepID=A0A1C7PFL5_9BACT|nr:hypothetical protein [Akkermansia glycaniphila]OCA04258.1 hypothetical protein AC781_00805 [Akkermansia glycaniphila]SEH97180.1 Hypothetical protein PYTT_2192 [Akkermansia glycaniphila]